MSKNLLAALSFLAIALIVSPVLGYGPLSALMPASGEVVTEDSEALAMQPNLFRDMTRSFKSTLSGIDSWLGGGQRVGNGTGNAAGAAAGSIAESIGGN